MITEEEILKSIAKCQQKYGRATYSDIAKSLSIDDISLQPFIKSLNQKRYIISTMDSVEVTPLGISVCKESKGIAKARRLLYGLSKFTLQRVIDIGIGIIIGLAVAYFTHHFGWQ